MREMLLTRQGFADALIELGTNDPRIVVLDADLAKSTLTCQFKDKFPKRFFDIGIAEQNMINVAGGMSLTGLIPFVSTYGVFLSGRAWEQIRTSICYGNLNVKFGGAHGGISVGPDGATHQALEEITIMRVLPNMTVIVPTDYYETKKAILAAAKINGPVYVRFGREKVPVVTSADAPFEVGKAITMKEGKDVSIIACGVMVAESLDAAEALAQKGISAEVINLHTIKPIDKDAIIASATKTGCVVTAEEHQLAGGFGSAVAEVLVQNKPVPMEMVGIHDTFGESGQPEELMKKYGITSKEIFEQALKVISRKS
ncbi:transketolase [Candidatus Peregrinibacteria bacterium RIFOXYB12_FULL_41_12]|nr:MAG: transketolase [Candidatus Peregrinibacteria bacterium RIFOXYA2_FULL_41_18]OGJ49363.1 MAG: transketolase [Candidatus Peregrinibacteria bacterium RIFOXYB12_FULL_41_12]OGJ53272.1 MAG: transketolase [Candidatus Peregrinibacteria bacterium RIFOXYC2_FULL_41_22]OGJ53488.1 MAG: transketolase [Candidatus Peregrinibacteria bacterium RIFOXYB2_FULL_41_88]